MRYTFARFISLSQATVIVAIFNFAFLEIGHADQPTQTEIFNKDAVDDITRMNAEQMDRRRREVAQRARSKKKCPKGEAPTKNADGTRTCNPKLSGMMGFTGSDALDSLPYRLGIWTSGQAAWERTDDRQTTRLGASGGVDVTYIRPNSLDGILVGLLYGHVSSHTHFDSDDDTIDTIAALSDDATDELDNKSKSRNGSTFGGYLQYFSQTWSGGIHVTEGAFDATPTSSSEGEASHVDMTSYTFAGSISYAIPIDEDRWLEPSLGASHSELLYDSAGESLGFTDGQSDLLWGSVLFGRTDKFEDFSVTTSLSTGLSCSIQRQDVRANVGLGAQVNLGGGISSGASLSVRGGDDYLGLSGKLNLRLKTDWLN